MDGFWKSFKVGEDSEPPRSKREFKGLKPSKAQVLIDFEQDPQEKERVFRPTFTNTKYAREDWNLAHGKEGPHLATFSVRNLQILSCLTHLPHPPSVLAMSEIAYPVNKSIQEINEDSWIVGSQILVSRIRERPSAGACWSADAGAFHVISRAVHPQPPSRPLTSSSSSKIQMVYDAGGVSAVWSIGAAFVKVKILDESDTRSMLPWIISAKRVA
ncbi:hypothetical protein LZ554_003945 [Drepanopeziza brunnea f. sp. 'monogermtubi']|nr:hypothetical protein LZ554_003945 [Drepanopeziza brunnea f. sp. 'monogermtubi']